VNTRHSIHRWRSLTAFGLALQSAASAQLQIRAIALEHDGAPGPAPDATFIGFVLPPQAIRPDDGVALQAAVEGTGIGPERRTGFWLRRNGSFEHLLQLAMLLPARLLEPFSRS
jgi:hypothetical protein